MDDRNTLEREIQFTVARSSGPGGQNVNKVNSKAILYWRYKESSILDRHSLERFEKKFGNKISAAEEVVIQAEERRDLQRNKDLCIEKLLEMIAEARIVPKKRIKTKPSRSSVHNRIKSKKKNSERKNNRKVDY